MTYDVQFWNFATTGLIKLSITIRQVVSNMFERGLPFSPVYPSPQRSS